MFRVTEITVLAFGDEVSIGSVVASVAFGPGDSHATITVPVESTAKISAASKRLWELVQAKAREAMTEALGPEPD